MYGVEPDMAIFGKALGNGYAITAAIGRREVMEAAQSTFISSTFWTERIGSVAGLASLDVMHKTRSWETITATGLQIAEMWKMLAERNGLKISVFGLPALIKFRFEGDNNLMYKTLITQEMLLKGYLAGNAVYVCTEHNQSILDDYAAALDDVFKLLRRCEDGLDPSKLLKGPVCHTEFRRLN